MKSLLTGEKITFTQAVSEEKYEKMVEEQLEKLKQEKESRARDGAPTPPSPGNLFISSPT